jgi:hypothetical protein
MKDNLLKNWQIIRVFNMHVVYGTIYNDTKKRFADGTKIHTSRIEKIDFVNGIVKTKNSIYNLDMPLD